MNTSDFEITGSWIWYNGYADIAFDEAQLGEFKKASAVLASAARQGITAVLIDWVRNDIRLLQRNV